MYQVRLREVCSPPDDPTSTGPPVNVAPINVAWFTHAGGASNTLAFRFRQATQSGHLGTHGRPVRVITPMPPLREEASGESFDGDLFDLATAYADALIKERESDPSPLIVIGHSFGTVIAYEVTRCLIARGILPHRLVVMSFPAPDRLTHETELHSLDDRALIAQVDDLFGGVPADIQNDPDSLKFFVPGLRLDLGLLERYRPSPDLAPLPVPVTAMVGTEDRAVNLADVQRWDLFTNSPVRLQTLPGDHFFPLARLPEVLEAATWDL